ncbi:hypothetical protein P3H15_28185 [Rhodococcus sp. T2V]|nr:hypothetical protein [Rhodococcus sp. T2V]
MPALSGLSTRSDDDFTIALCDALAMSLDVLTFYQERIANEHYLRTATERHSIVEMARLIGYQPTPGVAAATYLAFTTHETPGDLESTPAPIRVPVGTRVQSVPGQDEQPQSFETVEEIEARAEWNSIRAQQSHQWRPARGDTDLYLAGLDTRLKPGHAILIVGEDRRNDNGSERWDVRVVAAVEEDRDNTRTRIVWDVPLGHVAPHVDPASRTVQVFALRTRAALFGHNAPDPRLMSRTGSRLSYLVTGSGARLRWAHYSMGATIDLDRVYPGVTTGSWLALVSNEAGYGTPSLPGYTELYRAAEVNEVSRTDYALSGKITRVKPDTGENLTRYGLQQTLVLAESEELAICPRPLLYPLYGDLIAMDTPVAGLHPGQALAVGGVRQRIAIAAGVHDLFLTTEAGATVTLSEGDSLVLWAAPAQVQSGTPIYRTPEELELLVGDPAALLILAVVDRDGVAGTLRALGSQIRLGQALDSDARVSEVVVIKAGSDSVSTESGRTVVRLARELEHVYRRTSVRINANVSAATHGETVVEILGGGGASQPDQEFPLKQGPLTYVGADTPDGRASTLRVRVNDLLWTEVPTLYSRGGEERVHTVRLADEGASTVCFGDGVAGARPPTGQHNVRATYRKGVGVQGNVSAAKLTTLLSRPIGVDSATNPVPAAGGEDPEPLASARENAPLTVRTLERAVSVDDYADYSRAFAGIDKAYAVWVPAGPARGVCITVAGIDGATVVLSATGTGGRLLESLHSYGDPLVEIRLQNYRPVGFRTRLLVKVGAAYRTDAVLAAVDATLREQFSFAKRDFGQGVTLDEVAATVHTVEGVEAAQVVKLYRATPGAVPTREQRLSAALPSVSLTAAPAPAELLTLSDTPLELGTMP